MSTLDPDALQLILADIEDENPDAFRIEGADSAIIGIAARCGQPPLLAYSYVRLIQQFQQQGRTYDEAVDHVEANIVGAWVGPGTPIIVSE